MYHKHLYLHTTTVLCQYLLDSDMSKAILFCIARMIRKVTLAFRPMIVRQFQRCPFHGPQIVMGGLCTGCQRVRFIGWQSRHEVERELILGKVKGINQRKAKLFIKGNTLGGIFDAQHGLLPCGSAGDGNGGLNGGGHVVAVVVIAGHGANRAKLCKAGRSAKAFERWRCTDMKRRCSTGSG
jgi:predicted Fe-S protein YdhL (DUF1289 family)